MHRGVLGVLIAALFIGVLLGCGKEPKPQGPLYGSRPVSEATPIYSLAVHPLHNPSKLLQAYHPLIDYMNSHLRGARLALEASRDYANFEEKYHARQPAFLLPNPLQTLDAMESGYHVIAMAGEPRDFKGIFVVRKDSKLKQPADLKGKAVSYPSPTALAACIMPQYFLHQHGISVTTDIENRYVGSQESSIMNAYLGLTAAGATWPPPWRAFQKEHAQEAAELTVIWETDSLINNSVMVRDDIPSQVEQQVRALLLSVEESPDGSAILAGMETVRFLPASDKDYEVVRAYRSNFEREVRTVELR